MANLGVTEVSSFEVHSGTWSVFLGVTLFLSISISLSIELITMEFLAF